MGAFYAKNDVLLVENKNPNFWPEILKIVFETADFVEILILFLKISVGN